MLLYVMVSTLMSYWNQLDETGSGQITIAMGEPLYRNMCIYIWGKQTSWIGI